MTVRMQVPRWLLVAAALVVALAAIWVVRGSGSGGPAQAAPVTSHFRGGNASWVRLAGVTGQATDADHAGWSDAVSVTFGAKVVPLKEGGSTARRRADVSLGDVVVVKEIDKASPLLAQAICDGTNFPDVHIDLASSFADPAQQAVYLRVVLTNVQISSYQISGSSEGAIPTETLSLNFDKITWKHFEYDAAGNRIATVETVLRKQGGGGSTATQGCASG